MSPENRNPEFDLPEEILTLPLVCQQEVGEILKLVAEIQSEHVDDILYGAGVLNPNRSAHARDIVDLGENYLYQIRTEAQKIFNGLRFFKKEGGYWDDALVTAIGIGRRLVVDTDRVDIQEAAIKTVKSLAHSVVDKRQKETVTDFGQDIVPLRIVYETAAIDPLGAALCWAIVRDQSSSEENPFYDLLRLSHQLKVEELFFHRTDGEERLRAHLLVTPDGDGYVVAYACLNFGDNDMSEIDKIHLHRCHVDCTRPMKWRLRKWSGYDKFPTLWGESDSA